MHNAHPRHPTPHNQPVSLPNDGTTLAAPVKPLEQQSTDNVIILAQAADISTHTIGLAVTAQMLLYVDHHGLAAFKP